MRVIMMHYGTQIKRSLIAMKISELSIQELYTIVNGDNMPSSYRKGKDLVMLFNKYGGYREICDEKGLPSINKANGQRPSRKEFTIHHLRELNGTDALRVILEVIVKESSSPEECAQIINTIITNDGYSVVEYNGIYSITGDMVNHNNDIINEAKFTKIQNDILIALSKAKISVWIAVAWISNIVIVNKLEELYHAGVDVKILLNRDYTNHKYFPETDIPVFEKRGSGGGKMHHKFCVIDNQVVLHGSYNWSTNAETKNDEGITTTQGDLQMATAFSLKFKELLNEAQPFEK